MLRLCSVSVSILLLSAIALGQAAMPPSQTFHVSGTIADTTGATIPRAKVAFKSKQFGKSVTTNERGFYEADLPLGDYTMTAEILGFRPYRRPLFRVTSTGTIRFDFTLPVQGSCDPVVVTAAGGVGSPEDWEADPCWREDSFSIPSNDGVAFQLAIRYGTHQVSGATYSYAGEKTPNPDQVFVAYNLFSLRADQVIYDARSRTIRANGNVVAVSPSGVSPNSHSLALKIENGQALPIQ